MFCFVVSFVLLPFGEFVFYTTYVKSKTADLYLFELSRNERTAKTSSVVAKL